MFHIQVSCAYSPLGMQQSVESPELILPALWVHALTILHVQKGQAEINNLADSPECLHDQSKQAVSLGSAGKLLEASYCTVPQPSFFCSDFSSPSV